MQASAKEKRGQSSGPKRKKAKKEEDTGPEEPEEEAVVGKGTWDWNKCFVLDCKRVSDRYLKDLKDKNVVLIHTCASHRTMQEKAKKAYKGREHQINCHVCFGLNKSTESLAAGKIPGLTENFVICKTCKVPISTI